MPLFFSNLLLWLLCPPARSTERLNSLFSLSSLPRFERERTVSDHPSFSFFSAMPADGSAQYRSICRLCTSKMAATNNSIGRRRRSYLRTCDCTFAEHFTRHIPFDQGTAFSLSASQQMDELTFALIGRLWWNRWSPSPFSYGINSRGVPFLSRPFAIIVGSRLE